MKQYIVLIDTILNNPKGNKILLLDNYTTSVISKLYTTTEIIKKFDILICDNISNLPLNAMPLICIIYVHSSSMPNIISYIQNQRYPEYYVNIFDTITDNQINELAKYDTHKVIKDITEINYPFNIITNNVFITSQHKDIILFLKLHNKNPIIKHTNNKNITSLINQLNKTNFKPKSNNTLLLLYDRTDDPITPLINSLKYISLINDLFEYKNDIITINNTKQTLSSKHDVFFNDNKYLFLTDFSNKYNEYVTNCKETYECYKNMECTKKNINNFVLNYNKYNKIKNDITLHSKIIDRIMAEHRLHDIYFIQQEILNRNFTSKNLLMGIFIDKKINIIYKIKLYLLFKLVYKNEIMYQDQIIFMNEYFNMMLIDTTKYNSLIDDWTNKPFCFDQYNKSNIITTKIKNLFEFTQTHTSYLSNIINHIKNNNIKFTIIYINNGITFDEIQEIDDYNKTFDNKPIYLLSNKIINNDYL